MKLVILSAIMAVAYPASACWQGPYEVVQGENANIQSRNAAISRLQAANKQDSAHIEGDLTRIKKANELTQASTNQGEVDLQKSLAAVDFASKILDSTLVFKKSIDPILEKAKMDFANSKDLKLSEQIRLAATRIKKEKSVRVMIEQMANAVESLEASEKDWQKMEIDILQSFLDGTKTLTDATQEKMRDLREYFATRLNQNIAERTQAKALVDSIDAEIAAARGRIAVNEAEIAKMKAANKVSAERVSVNQSMVESCSRESARRRDLRTGTK